MKKSSNQFIVPPSESSGVRLDVILSKLSDRSRTEIRKLIVAGAVYVNRKRVRVASRMVQSGATIEMWAEEGLRLEKKIKLPELREADIIYEDEYLIAINKPSGLPTQPTVDEARNNAYYNLIRLIEKRDARKLAGQKPYLGLHHRLDKDTSGVLIFTKDKSVNAAIGNLFKEHSMTKEYLAVVQGVLVGKYLIKNHLGKLPKTGKLSQRYGKVSSGGDYAETAIQVVDSLQDSTLIRALPKTGRTHQIRVHLHEMGHSVLGDFLYFTHPKPIASRLMLHARSLTFVHPVSGVELKIEAPLPDAFRSMGYELKE